MTHGILSVALFLTALVLTAVAIAAPSVADEDGDCLAGSRAGCRALEEAQDRAVQALDVAGSEVARWVGMLFPGS